MLGRLRSTNLLPSFDYQRNLNPQRVSNPRKVRKNTVVLSTQTYASFFSLLKKLVFPSMAFLNINELK